MTYCLYLLVKLFSNILRIVFFLQQDNHVTAKQFQHLLLLYFCNSFTINEKRWLTWLGSFENLRGHWERLVQQAGFDNLEGNWKPLVYRACFDKCISKFIKYLFGTETTFEVHPFYWWFSKIYAKSRFLCLKVLVTQNEATFFESRGILSCTT